MSWKERKKEKSFPYLHRGLNFYHFSMKKVFKCSVNISEEQKSQYKKKVTASPISKQPAITVMVGWIGHHSGRTWAPTGFCFAALEQFEHPHVPSLDGPGSLIPVCKPTCKVVQLMIIRTKSWQPQGLPRLSFSCSARNNIIL